MEGQASGLLLGKVQAKDPDEGENGTVYYFMSGERGMEEGRERGREEGRDFA